MVGFGFRERNGVRHRRYRCAPPGGDLHVFDVPLDDAGELKLRSWSSPPVCPRHPSSVVHRNGTYGVRTPQPRQRYRCFPNEDGEKPHSFTPPLARHHVHRHEAGCVECEELRGVHHGETAVARRHSWPTRIVARALAQLADAGSYADVSRQALAQAERAAARHEALVRGGLTPQQADVVVEAEEAAADRGDRVPSPAEALAADATDDGDTASHAALRADRQRYRRHRRTQAEVAADKAADEARVEASAAGADVAAAKAAGKAARAASLSKAEAERAASGRRAKNAASAESHNVWHIAADWTEAFSPVIYEPVEQRLRAQALADRTRLDALRAAGRPLVRPQVLLLDDVPVYGRDRGRSRRDEGFFLLAAAEVVWKDEPADPFVLPAGTDERDLKLRLVQAMPKSTAAAWRLLFDELGYHPDFVVADAATGIGRAIEEHFDPARTVFVPSLWHVGTAVRTGLAATRGALVPVPGGGREPLPVLREHLAQLGRDRAIADPAAWSAWWDDLERICVAQRLPLDKVRARRRNYEQPFAIALAALADQPRVPVSTGGLETLLAKRVQPMLALRRTGFANIERTNRLFDLLIAREHGAFVELGDVITLLRADATPAGGWTVPLRDIADPRPASGRYSSLRDNLLITELAERRGLS
ncbi:hypothetical protein [Geodermatophilus chilensis]|uniref:hypothetical protein n=1 Tax=Geodermatophilus chilensis TaxID=2035835 RepID=UPI000C25F657|nr:hypothetical protein [Geodermatophilus chilensis]